MISSSLNIPNNYLKSTNSQSPIKNGLENFSKDCTKGQLGKNGKIEELLNSLLPLLQELIDNIGSNSGHYKECNKDLVFDDGRPLPPTHFPDGQEISSIDYSSGNTVISSNSGERLVRPSEAGSNDPRPYINGQPVIRVEYTENKANYTLADGSFLSGNKPSKLVFN